MESGCGCGLGAGAVVSSYSLAATGSSVVMGLSYTRFEILVVSFSTSSQSFGTNFDYGLRQIWYDIGDLLQRIAPSGPFRRLLTRYRQPIRLIS